MGTSPSAGRSSGLRLLKQMSDLLRGPERPSRVRLFAGSQWPRMFADLADHSGGPATDSHRFPYCPSIP
jgi:hypothetical protein